MPDTDVPPKPEPLTRAEQQAEAYRIASNHAKIAAQALVSADVPEWTREEKDGVLMYLEDIATVWGSRAKGCGRF